MDEEQQMEVFKNFPCQILICFLDFPWQIFFMETASHMWDFFPKNIYGVLLGRIIEKVTYGYKDFNYPKLFVENWQQSPNTHKRFVLNEDSKPYLLQRLFKSRDKKYHQVDFSRGND